MKRKRVIVTGGLGFIGSHLVEKLVEDNEVVIIDNTSTGKLENVSHLINEDLHVIEGDITTLDLATVFEGYDYVLHQAACRAFRMALKTLWPRTRPTGR